MSTATLNVWITGFGDPCHIEDRDNWFVHITDCEGKVLEWCGKKYSFIPAKCGHAEIPNIPPAVTRFLPATAQGQGDIHRSAIASPTSKSLEWIVEIMSA